MKRIIIYVVLIITFITVGVIGYINRPLDRPKDEILGLTYYRFNPNTNNYDEFMINKNDVIYKGTDYDLEGCKNYTYNPNTSIIKLDCNKAFRIGGETKEGIILDMEDKRTFFYSQKEKSYNFEFQKYFQTTESLYKSSGENGLREKEINVKKLTEIAKEKDYNFIYIKNNECMTSCTIFNHTFINFSNKDNTYYLNLEKVTEKEIEELNKEYETFPNNIKELTKNYPQVLVIKNGILEETIKIEFDGFDDSKYKNYAQRYGEENYENN